MTTINMPESNFSQGRFGGFGPGSRRPDAWPLQAVLNGLYEQPNSGQTWSHVLLANRIGLPPEDVRAAFTAAPPLVEWSVYATILRELEADDDDVAVCQRTYRQLAEHPPLRDALPPDIAALTTTVLFRDALRSMKGKLTLRELSDKMRKHNPKHTWERTTLSRYLSANNADEPSLPANKDRMRVLLTVLCEHAGRPLGRITSLGLADFSAAGDLGGAGRRRYTGSVGPAGCRVDVDAPQFARDTENSCAAGSAQPDWRRVTPGGGHQPPVCLTTTSDV